MLKRASLFVLAFTLGSVSLWAQQNPLIGTWKTNPAKSKAFLGGPPLTQVAKYEAVGTNGVKNTSDRDLSDGTTIHVEFTVFCDGSTAPYKGVQNRDGVAVRKIDAYTYQVFYKLRGETVQINFWIVSRDGKTLTTLSTGVGSDNKVFSRNVVHEKQ
ncbi:MAG: hypothetical protein HY316_05320 [Acidobacteria bacterium]|nr:hypothetical protein [Acidobacteriota bacterium]